VAVIRADVTVIRADVTVIQADVTVIQADVAVIQMAGRAGRRACFFTQCCSRVTDVN
jgi:late competence protein required for DNA uptake (superfamily II DNA/RNA helicase)